MAGLVGLLNYLDERKGREQYGNLLNEYTYKPPPLGTLGDDGLSIPAQSGFVGQGGLVSGGPPLDFYLRAGAIHGYQNLVQQAQVGQQAMERQLQNQHWQVTEIPLAEKTRLDADIAQRGWENARREFEWNNPSAYQKDQSAQGWAGVRNQQGMLDVARGNLDVNREQLDLQRQQALRGPQLGFKEQNEVITAHGNTQNALNVLTDYERLIASGEAPSFIGSTAKGAQFQKTYEAAMLPIVTKMFKPTGDAPSESELKEIKAYVGDLLALGTDAGKLQKLAQMKQAVGQYWQPYSRFGPAPTAQPGQSAYARSYPGSIVPNPGGLDPFKPGTMGGK